VRPGGSLGRRAAWQGLRGRLLLGTTALLTTGLLVADASAYVALSTFLSNRTDQTLRSLTGRIDQQVRLHTSAPISWSTVNLLIPSTQYVAVAGPDGQLLVAHAAVSGGDMLNPPAVPVPVAAAPAGLVTVASVGGGPGYRLSVIKLPEPDPANPQPIAEGVPFRPVALIIGASLADNEATLRRLLLVEAASTLVLLVAGLLIAVVVLDVGLRPLRTVATAARAIAAGRRDERIPVPHPQSEIGHVAATLNEAFDERHRAEDRIRRFIADASHELRTPLTTIRGWADLYLDGGISTWEKADLAMARVQDESARMQRLVEDMILLARLDEHRPLERRPTDLAELAEGLAADLRTVDPDREVTLTATTGATVPGDATAILQVLRNLLSNAARYTPPGTPIAITVGDGPAGVVVTVRDHGPGLSAEAAEQAFERFWRADSGRPAHGGSGLGLSIAREIAVAHGGSLTLHPADGGGLEARLALPRE
jgi:two-component system OmpR family sensor kinase